MKQNVTTPVCRSKQPVEQRVPCLRQVDRHLKQSLRPHDHLIEDRNITRLRMALFGCIP